MADIRKDSFAAKFVIYFILCIFAVLAIYPILWLLLQSFKSTQEYITTNKFGFPKKWVFLNYTIAWKQGQFSVLIFNSIFYTSVTVIFVILLSFMQGFAFGKLPNKTTRLLHGVYIVGILLTIQSIMVPLFLLINMVGLYNTRLGILISYIGISMPMGVYLSTEYIKNIPESLVESARIDCAKYFKIFTSIILPMAVPVAVTVSLFTFTNAWNEFMFINILTSKDSLRSIPVGINRFSGMNMIDYGKQFAALVIGLFPMLVFYLVFRKQITKGVVAGAVKG